MGRNDTPWDVYVDERKVRDGFALGFLVVPNTASFLHKLHLCRQKPAGGDGSTFVRGEVHWNEPSLLTLGVALRWIDCLFDHRGARFFLHAWPFGETKELVVLRFLRTLCRTKRLVPPYNVVVFLDFDADHAKQRIQNSIREVARVARCYHLHSDNNDCLQCCDLIVGALAYLTDHPDIRLRHADLRAKWERREKVTDAETKRIIAGHLAGWIDRDATCVYDKRHRGR